MNTIYVLLKRLIATKNYRKEELEYKIDVFYTMGRITDEQYLELLGLLNPPIHVEEPKVEEPKVEEPKVEEPKVEEPKVEDEAKVENTEAEQPKEEPKEEAEQPKAEGEVAQA